MQRATVYDNSGDCTFDPIESNPGVWIPRRPADRKRFRNEERKRKRSRRVISAPCWTGEPRPNGALSVKLESVDFTRLKKMCRELEEPVLYPLLSQPVYRSRRPSRFASQPPPPPIKTTNDEGFAAREVTQVIARHRWNDPVSSAVFPLVYAGRRGKEVVADRNVCASRLSHYVWMILKTLRNEASSATAA